jgi:phosphatidylglycerol:prolipoprotein diacylglycerol transferase
VIAGLHLYQWFAVAMVVVGLGMMMVPSAGAPPIEGSSLVPAAIVGLVFFLVCGFAMGVDFPESQKRFSRLSG